MFTEIALTPQVFNEDSNLSKELWLDSLYELGRGIFPRAAACPAMISNLYSGGWFDLVRNNIKGIVDHRVKRRVMELYQQMQNYLIQRPSESGWPEDEGDWIKEISRSHSKEVFARILLSDTFYQGYTADEKPVYSINHTNDGHSDFWECIRSDGNMKMNVDTQVRLLRPICLHAGYIALKTTAIAGGDDDEIYYWPHFTDRELVAGFVGDGIKYQRWGISFNHIARPTDRSGQTRWHIIPQKDLGDILMDTNSEEIITHFSIAL